MSGDQIREATESDVDTIAQCFINIALDIKSGASDPYIDGLPDSVTEDISAIARSYVDDGDAIALIYEKDTLQVGLLAGRIGESAFPPGYGGRVGHIDICRVAENHRRQGIAAGLVAEAERWFRSQGVEMIELAYLAQNLTGERAWASLGYRPFRVLSYKRLQTG